MGKKKKIADTTEKTPGLKKSAPEEIERAKKDADLSAIDLDALQESLNQERKPIADKEIGRQSTRQR